MVRVAPGLIVLCLLVAGCAQDGGGADEDEVQDIGVELEATDTTGIIRGVVVDERIVPLVGVNVTLTQAPGLSTRTNENGGFGFEGLEPGTYFMQVEKIGYFSVQASADVVAGDPEPPLVRVILKANPVAKPFWQASTYEGYIQCTTSVLVLCGIANVLTGDDITNDRFAWDQYFASNASLIQAEMVWDTTQALSPELYFELEALNDACEKDDDERYESVGSFLNNTSGVSPIYATINQTQVEAWDIGEVCPVWVSIFSGGVSGAPCLDAVPDPLNRVPGWCVGFTVQQRFTMFFHTFHGYMPPAGWRFAEQGDPPEPPQ